MLTSDHGHHIVQAQVLDQGGAGEGRLGGKGGAEAGVTVRAGCGRCRAGLGSAWWVGAPSQAPSCRSQLHEQGHGLANAAGRTQHSNGVLCHGCLRGES